MHLPAEFELAVACCRWPPSPGREAAVRSAAAAVDWRRFGEVVARHRVEGLAQDGLARAGIAAPEPVAASLLEAARRIARDNLAFAAEARRVARALAAAGVDALFVKGVILNRLAYGTLAIKQAADIDLLVDPADYPAALPVVRALGYGCEWPAAGASDGDVLDYVGHTKHSIWVRGPIALELHASLVDNRLMLPGVSARSPRQSVEVAPGLVLPTLAKEELFAYLCVHGATHAWSRLKWIADVAALLSGEPPAEIERLYGRARALGGGRSAAQALLLGARLFDLPLPGPLERSLRARRVHRWLERVALKAMLSGGGGRELDESVFGTAATHLSHFRLAAGWRYKASELRRKLSPGRHAGDSGGVLSALLAGPKWLLRRAALARAGRQRG
jgi:hypothetical protein